MEELKTGEVTLYLPDNFIQVGHIITNFVHNAVDSKVEVTTKRQIQRTIAFVAPAEIASDVQRGIRDYLKVNGLSFGVEQQNIST